MCRRRILTVKSIERHLSMNITIICVGKLKEKFWGEACNEYLKRLRPYANVRVCEVADIDPARAGGEGAAREREGAQILQSLGKHASNKATSHIILLDIEGKQLSSVQFSRHIDDLKVRGVSDIVFIIGGSIGVSAQVKAAASESLSFGAITLPHNLARVVLLEQIYRAFKISRGEPYHK